MPKLQQPESVFVTPMADGSIAYHYNTLPSMLSSFESALNPSVWRSYYQPFACAMANPQTDEVILARDHLGVAPLYYCNHLSKNLIFGETIPDVLKQLPTTPPLSENQILALFSDNKCYSDETFYEGIYRVEPGHLMHFKSDGTVTKKVFWQLEREGSILHYDNDQDYLDHFSMLLTESLHNATDNQQNIAAEFSAGLDSSAVYCAASNINVKPTLYMHTATPETRSAETYNDRYEKGFIEHYQLNDIQRIGVADFDPIQVFNEYASWFAGPAPYLFFMFARNIHQAVSKGMHPILLSGFGGDQGVSGQIPLNFFLPDLIRQGQHRQAWGEMVGHRSKNATLLLQLRRGIQYAQHMHPFLFELGMKIKEFRRDIKNSTRGKLDQLPRFAHPYQRNCFNNVREAEWFFLQGPFSHEVRMRIEYSSIISKKLGFEYRYPLLYPKLLEFFLSLPLSQKRHNGRGRHLLRRYVSQFVPGAHFDEYKKEEGLGIVPSTFDLYRQEFEQGRYQQDFKDLPYPHLIQHKNQMLELRNCIKGYMLKAQTTL